MCVAYVQVYSTCFHFESTNVFIYQYYMDCPFILVYILFFIILCFLDFYHYHITIVLKIKKYKNIPAVDTIYVFKYHSKPCFLCQKVKISVMHWECQWGVLSTVMRRTASLLWLCWYCAKHFRNSSILERFL